MKKLLLAGAILAASSSSIYAQANALGQYKTITTAVPFLLIAPDSRCGAMGETGVASTNDANAMHWNPSMLAFYPGTAGVGLTYSPWLRGLNIQDINLAYLSGYYNLGERGGVLGASLRYFSLGSINFTDYAGQPAGNGKPNEFAFDVGYARKVTDVLSAGVALRYINSSIAPNSDVVPNLRPANSAAGDISFTYSDDFKIRRAGGQMPLNVKAAVNVSNIGAKMSYTKTSGNKNFIPTNLRFGWAAKAQLDDFNSLTLTNDYNKLLVPSAGGTSTKTLISGIFGSFGDATGGFSEEVSEVSAAVGMEYWYRNLFAARTGFFYEDPLKGNRKFITLGLGVKYSIVTVDFSYLAPLAQNHPLGNTLRFSLALDFASGGNE
ncbi:MAG: type IX secretion system outer membrane channel protein PorV [Bacteroidia bacterium]